MKTASPNFFNHTVVAGRYFSPIRAFDSVRTTVSSRRKRLMIYVNGLLSGRRYAPDAVKPGEVWSGALQGKPKKGGPGLTGHPF